MNRRLLPLLWLLLLPFVVIVWWVQPSLDDLSIPLMLRAGEGSRLEVFRHFMHHWNGRYTTNLLAVLSPYTRESLFGYRLLLMLQFPALYFALYYLLSRLLRPVNPQADNNPSSSSSAPPEPPAAPSSLTSHFSSLTSHFSSLTSHFSSLTSHFSSLTSHFSSLTSPFSSLTSHFSSLTSHFSSLTSHFSSLTSHFSSLTSPFSSLTSHLSSLTSLLSAAILLLYLHWLPDITESIYWLSGAMVYTWALIVQLLVLGLMADTLEQASLPKTLLLALLLFLASGFNEIALAINGLLAVGYLLLASPRLRLRLRLRLREPHAPRPMPHAASRILASSLLRFLPLLAVLLASAIMLFSPGNAGRMWHFPEGGSPIATFSIAAVSTAKLLGVMGQNLPLLLTGFLLLPHLHSDVLRPALRPLAKLNPLWVAALGLLFLFACMVVPAWAMGINPPLRIYNYLGLFALGFFFWLLFSIHAWLTRKGIPLYPAFTGWGQSALIALIVLAMAADFHKQPTPFGEKVHPGTLYTYRGNLPRVTSDLFFRVGSYQESLKQREALIIQQKALGATSVIVPPLVNPPTSILFLDITPDPTHWINNLQARWYGVEKIEVSGEQ